MMIGVVVYFYGFFLLVHHADSIINPQLKMVGRTENKSDTINTGPNLIRISSVLKLISFLQASDSSNVVNFECIW